MKPLFVLLGVFIICLIVNKVSGNDFAFFLSGKIAMSAMLLFTAIGHFAFTKGMALMIPGFIPFKKQLVYLTGIIEAGAAICLLIYSLQMITAWFLIIFFIMLLPANIFAAVKHVDYQKGTYEGPGINYLWLRVPLQILLIVWINWFALQH